MFQWPLLGLLVVVVTQGATAGQYGQVADQHYGRPAVHAAAAFVPADGGGHGDDNVEYPSESHSYQFAYEINDEYGNTRHHREESDAYNNRKGSYSYKDANGVYRVVNYVADKDGFRAWIKTNEPGTANQNPADVHIRAEDPPPHVVAEAAAEPKPVHSDGPEHHESARPAVAAIPAFAHPGTLPVQTVHPVGAMAAPHVAAVPAFHHPTPVHAQEVDELKPPAPSPAVAAVPAFHSPGSQGDPSFSLTDARVYENSHGQLQNHGYGAQGSYQAAGPAEAPGSYGHHQHHGLSGHQFVNRAYASLDNTQGYYVPQTSHVAEPAPEKTVPVYESIRHFPRYSSGRGSESSSVAGGKHAIPVGVTYIKNPEPEPSYRRAASFSAGDGGVEDRYNKYMEWNRYGSSL